MTMAVVPTGLVLIGLLLGCVHPQNVPKPDGAAYTVIRHEFSQYVMTSPRVETQEERESVSRAGSLSIETEEGTRPTP